MTQTLDLCQQKKLKLDIDRREAMARAWSAAGHGWLWINYEKFLYGGMTCCGVVNNSHALRNLNKKNNNAVPKPAGDDRMQMFNTHIESDRSDFPPFRKCLYFKC